MSTNHVFALKVHGSFHRPSSPSSYGVNLLKTPLVIALSAVSTAAKHFSLGADVGQPIITVAQRALDHVMDTVFRFEDQPTSPFQSNFAPVEEIGETVQIECLEGGIPIDFTEGVYIRNGPNPLFGALKSTVSLLGRSHSTWIEGEGMLHAIYFKKDSSGKWSISYKNKYVESETFKIEKERNKPCFLPAIEGESPAIIAAYLLNMLRFGKVNKYISNTNVFEHGGKCYAIAENHTPQEIDISNLYTLGKWHLTGAWGRPFTSHPKTIPGTGELVIMGVDANKPFLVLGVISADGKKIVHKVDLKLERSSLCHDIGITEKYNVILDLPLVIDIKRLIKGGPLIKYENEGYARIGVMPRYGCAESIKWFDVASNSMFHIFNCFEDGDQVIVRGCRARGSIIPGPQFGRNKFEWFSKGFKPIPSGEINENCSSQDGLFFTRAYEWILNMKTGEVCERYLTGTDFSMDFPLINNQFAGLKNRFGYSQVVHTPASINCGLAKYGGLSKLHFEELDKRKEDGMELIKVECHMLEESQFCSGAVFVPKVAAMEEDDGYIISFVHNEETNASQVLIIDAKNLAGEAVAKGLLPNRVPYGFHGAYIRNASLK